MSKSFADLGATRAVTDALSKNGITAPFAIQSLVLEDALAGHDVLAKSPTGSGKTLAFSIPVVERVEATDKRPSALILAPTRELASQIVDDMYDIAHARALSVAAVYGGVGIQAQARRAQKAHIVVATPGRLEDLMQRGDISLGNVKILVLDEADRMLDMGFRPPVDRIVAKCPRDRQTMFFSATLDGEAGRVAREYTTDACRHEHVPHIDRAADTEHRFVAVGDRIQALIAELKGDRERTLVFVRTKRGADRLVKRLGAEGHDAVAMHGNKSQRQRERALESFESGHVDTLVATDVAARGIDVAGISHVIQFDPPDDRDGYVHRVGRTARAGKTGVGVTFVGPEQAADMAKIVAALDLQKEFEAAGIKAHHSGGGQRNGGGGQRNGGGGQRGGGGGQRGGKPRSTNGNGNGARHGASPRSGGSSSSRTVYSGSRSSSGRGRGRSRGR